jgi:hypothetical protein
MPCNASYRRFIFGKVFSYVLQIDMHLIFTAMLTKFYSCKKWVLHSGKPHVSHWKVPDHWTPRPFMSELRDLSPSLRVNDTQHHETRTLSTKEGPTALGTNMPSNKDGLNPTPPHMVRQSLAISIEEHCLPLGGGGGRDLEDKPGEPSLITDSTCPTEAYRLSAAKG